MKAEQGDNAHMSFEFRQCFALGVHAKGCSVNFASNQSNVLTTSGLYEVQIEFNNILINDSRKMSSIM